MAHLPCIGWVQIGGALALCTCSTPSEFISFWPSHHFCFLHVCLIMLYVLVGVYLLWHEGCVGFELMFPAFHPFFGLGIPWAKAIIVSPSPCFSFLCSWTSWLLILPYHFFVPAIALLSLLLYVTPWTCRLTFLPCQLTSLSIFCLGLPTPTFHIFTSLRLCWTTFLLCQPFSLFHSLGFLGLFTSSLPHLLSWAFC